MKDEIDKAVEMLTGYCQKHSFCENGCRFWHNGYCLFESGMIPCDWEKERERIEKSKENN